MVIKEEKPVGKRVRLLGKTEQQVLNEAQNCHVYSGALLEAVPLRESRDGNGEPHVHLHRGTDHPQALRADTASASTGR